MKRLNSIDVLRGLAILSMVMVHFVENLSRGSHSGLYAAVGIFGSFAAPAFTFLVGLSLQLSLLKQSSKGRTQPEIAARNTKRGLAIFVSGLIFAVIIWLPDQIFAWDILTLIGAAILILYPLRVLPPAGLIALSSLILLASPILRMVTVYASYWPYPDEYVYDFTFRDVLGGFFVNGYFPLFPWLVYSLVGMAVGKRLPKIEDWRLPFAGAGLVILAAIGTNLRRTLGGFWRGYASPLEFYPASTTFVLGTLGVILILFWILHRWLDSGHRETGPVLAFFQRYSRFSLTVYVLHHAVHIWPLYLLAWIGGHSPWYYYQDAVSTPVAFSFSLAFIGLFYGLIVWWGERNGKYSLEWLLAQVTK